jgi:uncharacterized protein (DUF885 family)
MKHRHAPTLLLAFAACLCLASARGTADVPTSPAVAAASASPAMSDTTHLAAAAPVDAASDHDGSDAATAAAAALHGLFADEWEYRKRENPFLATRVGDSRYDDRLPEVSPAAHARRVAANRRFLERLEGIDRTLLDEADKVNYDVFAFVLRHRIEGAPFRDWRIPLNSDSGFYMALNYAVRAQPFEDAQDYEAWLGRLRAFPAFVEQHMANMRQGLADGFTLPAEILDEVAGVIETIANVPTEESPLYAPFAAPPATIDAELAERLGELGRAAVELDVMPSLRAFHRFFVEEYLPGARPTLGASAMPQGEAYYASQVRYYTNLELTADEVHEIGLGEVERIRAQMDAIIEEVGFEGSFEAFLAFLRSDPQFYVDTPRELLAAASYYAKKADGKLPAFFGRLPRQPYTVEPVPAAIAPNYTGGRYVGAPLDGRRAGAYWVNTYALDKRTLYTLPALTLHEAVPGHHLQISLAKEIEGRPPFRQHVYPHAFGEGWGLYSEKLGVEMGIYETPYEHFGRLTYEMWRACRLVVDTGMHAKGWTRQQALDYLAGNTALSLLEVRTEIDRYIAWPGQALAYKIGELKIIELRERAEAALGADFDVREFHDRVLGEGGLPLPVLEGVIDRWIAANREAGSSPGGGASGAGGR